MPTTPATPESSSLPAREVARRIAGKCLGLRTRHLGRLVTRVYDQALRPLGLTLPQLSLLTAVQLLGPVQPSELCRRLDFEKSTLSRNLRRMREQGWLIELPTGQGRSKVLEITEAGAELLVRAVPAWEAAQEEVQAMLGAESRSILDQLLPPSTGR